MKQQYETKLLALEQRILATQEERDKVLKAMEGKPGMAGNSEKMTKIKSEYQDKLGKLQGEVKKLKTAQKEHAKLLRNQAQYEKQVEKLKSEVRLFFAISFTIFLLLIFRDFSDFFFTIFL